MSISCPNCTYNNSLHAEVCQICQYPLYTDDITTLQYTDDHTDNSEKLDEGEQKIQDNLAQAYNVIPESFFPVNMLYIQGNINGKLLNIFIDTGAQMTIMSQHTVKKCGLEDLVDKKYQGKAVGVGTQKILGKIYYAEIDLNSVVLPCSFTILKQQGIDIILGLDMLNSHRAEISLAKKTIKFGKVEISFLPPHLIPKSNEK